MNAKSMKKALLFNDFLTSLSGEPLGIKYKRLARIFHVSESTVSKLRHAKLNKMPSAMHPDVIGAGFAQGVVQSFATSGSTVRRFSAYARMICDSYLISEKLENAASALAGAEPVDDDAAKKLCTAEIPRFIRCCYEEAYANSEMDFSGCMVSRCPVQSDILYQKICDVINRDTFDDAKLRQLLNVVYAANIRRQINTVVDGRSVVDLVDRFVQNQAGEPFYNYVHRTEVISISEDAAQMVRTIKGRQQIVLQTLRPQEVVLRQSLNHYVDMPEEAMIRSTFQKFTCTVNHIPIVKYLNLHENARYTGAEQLLTVRQAHDYIGGTTGTEVDFRFRLYPGVAGEAVNISYEYRFITPFIENISCNYCFSLFYPCKFLEHEFALDAKTKKKWGVQVKLFTPMTTSACTSECSDELIVQSGGTSDLKRITFYDWAMPGTGYFRNLYELKYAGGGE
ncbi:hypothetical protein ACRQV7_04345 [Caproiciproducens sp. R2]|uniref:hypothetical protein n=1 Tax=Caproiciproducens sp. R2 TaxID=3435187 RepID=UPI00403450CC